MNDRLAEELAALEARGLQRRLRVWPDATPSVAGAPLLNFASNDYLDLARDPEVKAAATAAIARWGCGATASRLMCGTFEAHAAAENALAAWLDCESALIFGSGFLANLGVITALADEHTVIFEDRLNHASLIDGARLSGARLIRYRHGDAAHLAELLRRHAGARRRLVVTDTVFSMDGDLAPLRAIAALCAAENVAWIADEAHALGVFGPHGRGCCALAGVRPTVLVGTFSKALGSYGGFAATDGTTRAYLVNRARSFIFSTGLAPSCVAAALAAVAVIQRAGTLGEQLLARAASLRGLLAEAGLDTRPSCSPIIPVLAGSNDRALALAAALEREGILAVAIRPPTVPPGTARLRLSLTRAHTEADLHRLAGVLAALVRQPGPASAPVRRAGDRPTLIVAGGWMFGTAVWDPFLAQLPGWPVHRLDWQQAMQPEAWEACLSGIAGPVLLVGWSLSSLACLTTAARHRERVAGLVLLAGTARLPADGDYAGVDPAAIRAMRTRLRRDTAGCYRDFLSACHAPAHPPAAELASWTDAALGVPAATAMAGLSFLLETDARAVAGEVTAPTLLLHGRADAVVPAAQGVWLQHHLPHAEHLAFDQGHLPGPAMWQAAADWLRRQTEGAAAHP